MKEELLNKALDYLNAVELFASEQVPVFIEELLMFYTVKHGVVLFIGIALAFKAFSLLKKGSLAYDADYKEAVNSVVGIVLGFVSTLFILFNFVSFLKVTFAPRLYLIETITSILTGGCAH